MVPVKMEIDVLVLGGGSAGPVSYTHLGLLLGLLALSFPASRSVCLSSIVSSWPSWSRRF